MPRVGATFTGFASVEGSAPAQLLLPQVSSLSHIALEKTVVVVVEVVVVLPGVTLQPVMVLYASVEQPVDGVVACLPMIPVGSDAVSDGVTVLVM